MDVIDAGSEFLLRLVHKMKGIGTEKIKNKNMERRNDAAHKQKKKTKQKKNQKNNKGK